MKASELITPVRHEAVETSAEPEAPVKHAEVIAFANQKGGVAKTTTTLNLAVAFAESGYRVLCVDLDPQGNLTMTRGSIRTRSKRASTTCWCRTCRSAR